MRQSDIRVNHIYGRVSPKTGKTMPQRTIRAIYPAYDGRTMVLYTLQGENSWDKVYRGCYLFSFARWAQWQVRVEENERWKFLDDCRAICTQHGVSYTDAELKGRVQAMQMKHPQRAVVYEDEFITIVTSTYDGEMRVVRKRMDIPGEPHLNCENPIIHVDKIGKPYRYHGEYTALLEHVATLLETP